MKYSLQTYIAIIVFSLGALVVGTREWQRFNKVDSTKIQVLNAAHKPANVTAPSPVPPAEVQSAADAAAEALTKFMGEDGRFLYRRDILSQRPSLEGRYNMARHAGALFGLTEYQIRKPSNSVRAALRKAISYLVQTSKQFEYAGQHLYAVEKDATSSPQRSSYNSIDVAATSLAAISLIYVERALPGSTPGKLWRGLGELLLLMQRQDGSMIDRLDRVTGSERQRKSAPGVSLPTPTMAALAFLYGQTGEARFLKGAMNNAAFIARSYNVNDPGDFWYLIATSELLRSKAPLTKAEHESLLYHSRRMLVAQMREQILDPGDTDYGAFLVLGRKAPATSRLVGMMTALNYLPNQDADLKTEIRSSVDRGIIFLNRLQIHSGEFRGLVPRELGSSDVRVDYTQHALNALIHYVELAGKPTP